MKKVVSLSFATFILLGVYSCKKDNNSVTTGVTPASNPINQDTICGNVKGTMLSGKTYYIKCDIAVAAADTLYVQSGVTVKVLNNATFFISGAVISEGTQAQPVTFTGPDNNLVAGAWGGFQCDSAKYVSFKWTHVDYTGGPDATGSARRSIALLTNSKFIFQDSWLKGGLDDGLRLQGAQVSILRNTFEHNGGTDGEAINLKDGCVGDVAYNVVWSQAGTGIKLETNSTVLFPQTKVNVYNNTVVNSGFRRGAGEPGRGINCDLFTSANIYNNIIVNTYYGLDITALADTNNVHYGNNFFYTAVDSVRPNFYPAGSWGKPQTSDVISTSTSNNNPMFVSLDANVMSSTNNNNVHLQTGSPAIGKGNPTYNADMGAYPTNGQGNQH